MLWISWTWRLSTACVTRNHALTVAGLLASVVFAAYFNSFSGVFQFDDYNVIVGDPVVHSWNAWIANLGHGIRPLLKFSYMLNWISGLGITGFHLVNMFIHLCNAGLVFLLARHFVNHHPLQLHPVHAPLLAALLFTVHPIHTEAVTYISGRSSSLMTLFYLSGLLAYASGRLRSSRILLYFIAPLTFIAAISVKESAITFPMALLTWELCSGGTWRTVIRYQWPYWVVFSACALFFLGDAHYWSLMSASAQMNNLQVNFFTQIGAFLHLMNQWVWPLQLNADPDLPVIHGFAAAPLQTFIFGLIIMVAGIMLRKRPWVSFALIWAIVHLLLLYLFFPRTDIANERQMYLAGWPLFLVIAIELTVWLRGRTLVIAGTLLVLALGCLTVARNQIYVSEVAYWADAVSKSPHKARTQNNLGYVLLLMDRREDARKAFMAALQIDPGFARARNNLARLDAPQDAEIIPLGNR